jgi:glycosyltransferase involved in cell wall biosynthesis
MSKPLVTFTICSYNQERYIREAVRGALAQTHFPLQIIMSDDCSQDSSFEILQEEAECYKGPHEITLNRNERNLGMIGHFNRLMELAKGDLVVVAAGDDVSLPDRTEELVRVWASGGYSCVWSGATIIDDEGHRVGELSPWSIGSWKDVIRRNLNGGVGGAVAAWDPRLFDIFGPLPEGARHEDYLLEFRAALLGGIACIDKPLVKYRRHSASASMPSKGDLWRYMKYHSGHARAYGVEYESWLRDLELLQQQHPDLVPIATQDKEIIAAKMEYYKLKGSVPYSCPKERLRSYLRLTRKARRLGARAMLRAGLLSASPLAYHRIQQAYQAYSDWRDPEWHW